MNDKIQDRTNMPERPKELMKIDPMIFPVLVILIAMLVLIVIQQQVLIGEYKEGYHIMAESDLESKQRYENLVAEYDSLREDVDFAWRTLSELDLMYIETIPTGAELRIRLAMDALVGGD